MKLLIILVCILTISCSKIMVGTYQSINDEFQFYKNKTFKYRQLQKSVGTMYSEGIWYVNNDTLYLKSHPVSSSFFIKNRNDYIAENQNKAKMVVVLNFQGFSLNQPFRPVFILFNESKTPIIQDTLKSLNQKYIIDKPIEYDSLSIQLLPNRNSVFLSELVYFDKKANLIEINVSTSYTRFNRKTFSDSKFSIKNRQIIDASTEKVYRFKSAGEGL
jgi:hypothetical protein